MKHLVALAVAAASLVGETSQERGKRVVNESLAALGGERFLLMKDRVETGRAYSFYRDDLTGLAVAKIYTRYVPNRGGAGTGKVLLARERHSYGKEERAVDVFLEDRAYRLTFRGAKPIPKDRFNRYRESTLRNIFYILHQRLNEPGLIIEWKGSEVLDNLPVDVVDITDSQNHVVTVYFQKSTHFPVKQVFMRRDPETRLRIEETEIFSKYRDVGGGVHWPFDISRARNGEKFFQIFSESVVINQNLTDDLFTVPGNMKILPEK